jgi:hypothetical protein
MFVSGDPEEIQRHVQAVAIERSARFFRLMEELAPPDLATFIEMLNVIIHSDNGAVVAGKLLGEAGAIMRLAHGDACFGCGNRHDLDMLTETQQQVEREREQDSPEYQAALKEYNMEHRDGRLFCAGCGLEYTSMNDRMLRQPGPDGCHGCKQKAAWG